MTALSREDIIKYIIKIQLNFENSYTVSTDLERELLVESWYEALCEYPKEVCDSAVNSALKRAKFAPRLGDITEEIDKILNADQPTDEELWSELTSVLGKVYEFSRYLSYPQYYKWAAEKLDGIYNNLSEQLKTYVVNRSALVELATIPSDNLQYERARFFKQMPVLKKHTEQKLQAQKFLQEVSAKQLPQGKNK